MMKLQTALIGWVMMVPVMISAQPDTLRIPSMQEVRKQNSWLAGNNPIGLSCNRFRSFSVAEAAYTYNSGNQGMPVLPASSQEYSVWSESYQRIGKVALYGRLHYAQGRSKGQNWQGMTNDYWQSVNLCDTISGKRHGETYHLAGAFSLPFHERWLIGLHADYRVQTVAKETDPRNKNQWSEWIIRPGVGYKIGRSIWGISFCYANKKETVDYQNMGAHATYPFFAAYPLSFFKTLSRDEAVKWDYAGHEAGAAIQFDSGGNGLRLFLQVSGSLILQDVESNRMQSQKEADSDAWQIDYLGKLQHADNHNRHEWSLQMAYKKDNNYEPVQEQGENGVWNSYGKVLRSTRKTGSCRLTYEYRRMRDRWNPRFYILTGVCYRFQENALLFYPVRYLQPLSRFTLYSTLGRNFVLSDAYMDCSLSGRYGVGAGSILKEQKLVSSPSTEEVRLWQDAERLQQDYDYETAPRLAVDFSVTYTRKNPLCWFLRLSGSYEYSGNCLVNDYKKKIITSFGLIF